MSDQVAQAKELVARLRERADIHFYGAVQLTRDERDADLDEAATLIESLLQERERLERTLMNLALTPPVGPQASEYDRGFRNGMVQAARDMRAVPQPPATTQEDAG
jgi:hypothetical protein